MRVITVEGLRSQRFERELRETLATEVPEEAEVYVVGKPEAHKVETRVVLDGGSATETISFLDPGELTTKRFLEIARGLVSMLLKPDSP